MKRRLEALLIAIGAEISEVESLIDLQRIQLEELPERLTQEAESIRNCIAELTTALGLLKNLSGVLQGVRDGC